MPRRPRDWLVQAAADLESAKALRAVRRFESCCFYAHQAAEKALKAVWESQGVEARGHGLNGLSEPLDDVAEATRDAARRLNRHYLGTRYPDAHHEGAPAELYTELDAEQALADAERILDDVRRRIPAP